MKTINLDDKDFQTLISLFDKEIGDLELRVVEMDSTDRKDISVLFKDHAEKLLSLKNKILEQIPPVGETDITESSYLSVSSSILERGSAKE